MNGISQIDGISRLFPYCEVNAPFGPECVTYRLSKRIFALLRLESEQAVALKVSPELVESLLDRYEELRPAYHLNKKHWIQLQLPTERSEEWVLRLLRHSYAQVWRKLSKREQQALPLGLEIYNQAQRERDLL
jgi:Uncharacterized protein conserved in bacteria